MFLRTRKIALFGMMFENRWEFCKIVSLLALLLAHILLGTGVLRHSNTKMEAQTLEENTMPSPLPTAMVSQRAPNFRGTAVHNKQTVQISLSQYAGQYVVLLFYPLDFSSVCPSELIAFSDRLAEFRKLNAVVIACSVDSLHAHMTWQEMDSQGSHVKVPLLSDLTHKISQDYGVYLPSQGHSQRAQFIIDPNGIIRQMTINDLLVPRSVDESLRLIESCRYADKTGNPLLARILKKCRL